MPTVLPFQTPDSFANYPPAMAAQLVAAPFWLTLPVAFGTADATALYTVPTGAQLFIHRTLWVVATDWTGGTSSTIGLSSDATGYSTKGDIQGGAAGDAAAALTAATKFCPGTVGAKFGSNGVIVIPAGKIIRFDRITSAFTTGTGVAQLWCSLLPVS